MSITAARRFNYFLIALEDGQKIELPYIEDYNEDRDLFYFRSSLKYDEMVLGKEYSFHNITEDMNIMICEKQSETDNKIVGSMKYAGYRLYCGVDAQPENAEYKYYFIK